MNKQLNFQINKQSCPSKPNRYASILDLNNYFKIEDLLKGLTEDQQALLRANIGVDLTNIVDQVLEKLEPGNISINIDDKLDSNSTNPVQNKVITSELKALAEAIEAVVKSNSEQNAAINLANQNASEALSKANELDGIVTSIQSAVDTLSSKVDNIKEVTVDSELSENSINPVQNKVINQAILDQNIEIGAAKADASNALNAATTVTESVTKLESTVSELSDKVTKIESVSVDSSLSDTSENPVQNKVINQALSEVTDVNEQQDKDIEAATTVANEAKSAVDELQVDLDTIKENLENAGFSWVDV